MSDFAEEGEVLLRGPFFQMLRVGSERIADADVPVIETMIVNSNRDHFGTLQTGEGYPVRSIFRMLVQLRRYDFCSQFCRDHAMHGDEAAYLEALSTVRRRRRG